jgi:hemoglobin-like flavoprotein
MLPFLRAMGIRHLKYQTQSAHYAAVGENLVAVLGEHLSKEGEWTPEMKQCWDAALSTAASVMIEAAENPEKFKDELIANGYQPDGSKFNDSEPWNLLAGTPG